MFKDQFKKEAEDFVGYFGFEVNNVKGEAVADTIHYDEKDNILWWNGDGKVIRVQVDNNKSVNENINALYATILENGYYDD